MKTEKAIQVLRDYASLNGKLASDIYAACPYDIRMAIEDLVAAVHDTESESERELKRLLDEEREAHTKTANELYEMEAELDEDSKILRGAITGWQNKWECAVELAAQAQADLYKERKEGEEQARLLGMGSEREAKLIAERDLWRAEAQRWREQALDLEAQIETAIKRIQWRQDNLDRDIKELKGDY